MANQELERALTFAGYEVDHDWGDRRAQRPARDQDLPRRHPLALEGLARAGEGRRGLAAAPGNPHPGRGLAARRRGLPVHRRAGGERQGRGLLQRRPGRQDLQDRARRQGEHLPRRLETRERPGVRPGRPALRRRHRHGAGPRLRRRRTRPRSSPTVSAATTWSSLTTAASTSRTRAPAPSRARCGTSARRGRSGSWTPA